MAGRRFELAMEPTAIGLVRLNSNSETLMIVICDARLIYGRGWISRVFIHVCCAALNNCCLGPPNIFKRSSPHKNSKTCLKKKEKKDIFTKYPLKSESTSAFPVRFWGTRVNVLTLTCQLVAAVTDSKEYGRAGRFPWVWQLEAAPPLSPSLP